MQENVLASLDVILNKWAIVIQVSTVLVLVLVFFALWKNFARKVVLTWMMAWIINLIGLLSIYLVIIGIEYFSKSGFRAIYLVYAFCKIWFAILLVHGLSRHLNQNLLVVNNSFKLIIFTLFFVLIVFITKINTLKIQIIVYTIVGTIITSAGIYHLIKYNNHKKFVLPSMFCIEGVLFLHHAWVLFPTLFGAEVPAFMSHISFLDSIVELFLGITCLFAIVYRVIEEYQRSNLEMENAQKSLRKIIDNDPLTGLWNRRKLEDFMAIDKNNRATLVYIDVDKFKAINDSWGHATGDACLKRIATCLRHVFDNQTGLFRLGGDEFLSVIPDISEQQLSIKLSQLKSELAQANNTTPVINLSVGTQCLTESIDFKQAIKLADKNMYHNKKLSV